MRCFTACFGSSRKHGKTENKNPGIIITPLKDQDLSQSREINEALLCNKIIAENKDKSEEQLNCSAGKKVRFDLNVKPCEKCQVQEDTANSLVENDEKGKREEETKDGVVKAVVCSGEEEEEKAKKEEQRKEEGDLLSDSSVSSLFTYPSNHRYQNCASSDDECVDMDFKKGNSDDEVDRKNDEMDSNHKDKKGSDDFALVQEESSESFFSISIESRKENLAVEIGEKEEVSSPLKPLLDKQDARNRCQYVHSVLNPIENLSQWKEAVRPKTTSSSLKDLEKENINLEQENEIPFCEEPSFMQSNEHCSSLISKPPKDDEIAVDTSLSSWLMESEKSPGSVGNSSLKRTMSPKSFEDRPILGALTVEELKQMSKSLSPSPRRSPSHSPDEMPIIGTVGSYWRHTRGAADAQSRSSMSGKGTSSGLSSRSRHCRKDGINSKSTPSQTKLERGLDDATTQI